jgi:ABC-2 type transport system permease protein
MRSIDLAAKDLLQIVRDWKSALFLVIMPILFTLFFGFILAPGEAVEDSRLPVALINQDGTGGLAVYLEALLAASDVVHPVALDAVTESAIDKQIQDGTLAAAIVVPTGFARDALAGNAPPLTVIVDQTTAAGQTAYHGIETSLSRLRGALQTARLSAEQYAATEGLLSGAAREAYVVDAVDLAIAQWQQPPLRVTTEQATGAAVQGDEVPAGFAQSSPGMMVQFAIFGLITSAMVLVVERKTGALRRLLTTPARRATIIGGHLLAMFLAALGQFLFGVDYLRAPLATLTMALALSLWAASLGLLIGALGQREEQVVTWSLIAMFLFAGLGGAWFPLEVAGGGFVAVGRLMPTAWAMEGLQNIVVRGQGLAAVLLPAGVLFGYAAIFFGLAVWRFRFE